MPATLCPSVHVMIFSKADPLLNFSAKFVVHLVQIWVLETRHDQINVGYSHFSLKWETLTRRLCALIEPTHLIVSLEDEELTTDLAHDRQLLLSQKKHVMVIRGR